MKSKGYTFIKYLRSKPYKVQLRVGNKNLFIGYYATSKEAAKAYKAAKKEYGKK